MNITTKLGVDASVSSVVNSDERSATSPGRGSSCKTKQQVTLTDLCPADKEKVANLIRELAKLGAEKEKAIVELTQQKNVLKKRDFELANHRAKMSAERDGIQTQLQQCQDMLDKYQTFLSAQQDKWSQLNTAGCSSRTSAEVIPPSLSIQREPLETSNVAVTQQEKLSSQDGMNFQKPVVNENSRCFSSNRSESIPSPAVQQFRKNDIDLCALSANPLNGQYIQPILEHLSPQSLNTFCGLLSKSFETQSKKSNSNNSRQFSSFSSAVPENFKNLNLSEEGLHIDQESFNTGNNNCDGSNYYYRSTPSGVEYTGNDCGRINEIAQHAHCGPVNQSQNTEQINLKEQPIPSYETRRFSLYDDADGVDTLLSSSDFIQRRAQNDTSGTTAFIINANAPFRCNDSRNNEIGISTLNRCLNDVPLDTRDEAQCVFASSQTDGALSQRNKLGLFPTSHARDAKIWIAPNEYNESNKLSSLNPESKLSKIVNEQKCGSDAESQSDCILSAANFFASRPRIEKESSASRPRINEQERYDDEVSRATISEFQTASAADSLSNQMRSVRLGSDNLYARHSGQISADQHVLRENDQYGVNSFRSDDQRRVPAQRSDNQRCVLAQGSEDQRCVLAQGSDDQNRAVAQRSDDQNRAVAQRSDDQRCVLAQGSDDQNRAVAQRSDDQRCVPAQRSDDQRCVPAQRSDDQRCALAQHYDDQRRVPAQRSEDQRHVPAQRSDDQRSVPAQRSDDQRRVPAQLSDDQRCIPAQHSDDQRCIPAQHSDNQRRVSAQRYDDQRRAPAQRPDDQRCVLAQVSNLPRKFDQRSQQMQNDTHDAAQNYEYTLNSSHKLSQLLQTQIPPIHSVHSNKLPEYPQMIHSAVNNGQALPGRDFALIEQTQIFRDTRNNAPKSAYNRPRQMSDVANNRYHANRICKYSNTGNLSTNDIITQDARNILVSSRSGLPTHEYSNNVEYQINHRQINDVFSSFPVPQTFERPPLRLSDRQRTKNMHDWGCAQVTTSFSNYPDNRSIDLVNINPNIEQKSGIPHHFPMRRIPNERVVESMDKEFTSSSMLNRTLVGNISSLNASADDALFVDRTLSRNVIASDSKILNNSDCEKRNSVDLSVDLLDFILHDDNGESTRLNSVEIYENLKTSEERHKSNLRKSDMAQKVSKEKFEVSFKKPSQQPGIQARRNRKVNLVTDHVDQRRVPTDLARHKDSRVISSDHSGSKQILQTDVRNRGVDTDLEESRLLDDIFFVK